MAQHRHDVAILGGGLIGMAMAMALGRHGISVLLVDPAPVEQRAAPDFDGRAYAVAPGSRNLLAALGVWEAVADEACAISSIVVSDQAPGPATPTSLHFDPCEAGRAEMGWILEDRWLRRALLNAVAGTAGVTHLAPMRAEVVERDAYAASVQLSSGERHSAALVVACDGRRSATARAAGIEYLSWGYEQTGLVSAIEHELPHGGVARQAFYPGGPCAVLPLPGNRVSIVWSERAAEAERIHALDDDAYLAALGARIGADLGTLRLAGRRWAYPLSLSLATSFVAPRLVVAGDAAHGVHPIAGQGMNMGLRDVAALTEVLVEAARLGLDLGAHSVLENYQTWRRFDATALSLGMDGLNRLFSNDFAAVQTVRNLGLGCVGQARLLRRFFASQASGTAEGMPSLLRGESI